MKLVSYVPDAAPDAVPGPGLLHQDADLVVDLQLLGVATMTDLLARWDELLPSLRDVDRSGGHGVRTTPLSQVRLAAPVPRPTKLTAVGLNYRDHAAETGMAIPQEPMLFAKHVTSVIGPEDAIVLPPQSDTVDYEAELAVVLGRGGYRLDLEQAAASIAGYMAFNDVSARDLQQRQGQWTVAKSFETFSPSGPWLVTTDEVADPQALAIECRVNGEALQSSSTKEMIFSCAEIVRYMSQIWRLEPGDVIATGTPHGVGLGRDPQVFLRNGDVVEVTIERLGTLRNPVRTA
jgi:acylpyruvate hydrolase